MNQSQNPTNPFFDHPVLNSPVSQPCHHEMFKV